MSLALLYYVCVIQLTVHYQNKICKQSQQPLVCVVCFERNIHISTQQKTSWRVKQMIAESMAASVYFLVFIRFTSAVEHNSLYLKNLIYPLSLMQTCIYIYKKTNFFTSHSVSLFCVAIPDKIIRMNIKLIFGLSLFSISRLLVSIKVTLSLSRSSTSRECYMKKYATNLYSVRTQEIIAPGVILLSTSITAIINARLHRGFVDIVRPGLFMYIFVKI